MEIRTAAPEEWPAAFELALHTLPEAARRARVLNALTMLASGELDPDGILVAHDGQALRGVQVCVPLPGASGLFWVPRTLPFHGALQERLVQRALDWLRGKKSKLAQALLVPEESAASAPLLRRGFKNVTRIQYLEHELAAIPRTGARLLSYMTYSEADQAVFHKTLLRTYEATLDCPELTGVRTVDEIIAGHKAQGHFRPEHWWLGFVAGQPVAVAMVTEVADLEAWDLSYLGVIPEGRRQGLGRELTEHVLRQAQAAHAPKLIVAVDERNSPALQLYKLMGFQLVDFRDVYLYFWDRSLAEDARESGTDLYS